MKRHPALRALSSDHHQGLVQARRLVRAAEEAPLDAPVLTQAAAAFLEFWAHGGAGASGDRLDRVQPAAAPWELVLVRMSASCRKVLVDVIDRGVVACHPDLAGQVAVQ